MNAHSGWKRQIITILGALALLMSATPLVHATDLPPGVLTYLRQKDPRVKVRFDGLVLFSNGESYVPVIPQDPALNPDSQQVIANVPEKVPYPDLIQFDNNFFLMRLIQTSTGRLTFPKMADYPLQLKEGLLPQDFVIPKNLFIPVELKVILGALPYNPSYTAQSAHSVVPLGVALNTGENSGQFKSTARQTYVFDLTDQKVLAIDPITGGAKSGEVAVNCAPSSLKLSPDGKLLFVPCLASNELVVVDTASNLIKTRISVGQRPDAVVYVYPTNEVVISNRYSSFLSVVNSNELLAAKEIDLGQGTGGAMALIPGEKTAKLVVADAFKPTLYIVDMTTRMVEKMVTAIPEISALTVTQNEKGEPEIWAVSRTKSQLMALDLDGKVLMKPMTVGHKPIDLVAYDNKILILSAGDSKIHVIDRQNKILLTAIPLGAESFPSGIVAVPSEKLAYISMAASNHLVVFNLESNRVEDTLPVPYRAGMIGMTPDKTEVAQYAVDPSLSKTSEPLSKNPTEKTTSGSVTTTNQNSPKKIEPKKADEIPKNKKSEKAINLDAKGKEPSIKITQPAKMLMHQSSSDTLKNESNESEDSSSLLTPATNSGKFKLNIIKLGRGGEKEDEEKERLNQTNGKKTKNFSINTHLLEKNTETVDKAVPTLLEKETIQEGKPNSTGSAAEIIPVKAGARVEQKPLAMPLDLPSENTFSSEKKPGSVQQGKLPAKPNKKVK
jgi:YVTN family beta-propeller protein